MGERVWTDFLQTVDTLGYRSQLKTIMILALVVPDWMRETHV